MKKRNDKKCVQELCQMSNEDDGGLVTTDIATETAVECPRNSADESSISEVISVVIPEEVK